MTALTKYAKLESRGLWRDLPEAQRREVVVNLGDASLILSDPRSDVALAHWSLPAVTRINGTDLPALYAPGDDAAETLEIEDVDMIAALDTVQAAVDAAQPRPGRLRGVALAGALAGVLAAGVFWLPDAVVRHTVGVLPPATRAEIGRMVLADLTRLTGAPCAAPDGVAALARLSARVFGPSMPPRLTVLRQGMTGAIALPGDIVVLAEPVIALADGPDLAAGMALAETLRAQADDPVRPVLAHAGMLAALRLLATGALPSSAVQGYAEVLLATKPDPLPAPTVLPRFAVAGVPAAPYAYALDPSGESVLELIEGDPYPQGAPRPLLPDDDWVQVQDICTL